MVKITGFRLITTKQVDFAQHWLSVLCTELLEKGQVLKILPCCSKIWAFFPFNEFWGLCHSSKTSSCFRLSLFSFILCKSWRISDASFLNSFFYYSFPLTKTLSWFLATNNAFDATHKLVFKAVIFCHARQNKNLNYFVSFSWFHMGSIANSWIDGSFQLSK